MVLEIQEQLDIFVRAHFDPAASAINVEEGDGHAGLTFLFDIVAPGRNKAGYVLKKAPSGVRRSGNTDIYRQAPLLRALYKDKLPVPDMPWAGEDERWFGAPYIIMQRLPGRTYQYWDPHPSFPKTAEFAVSTWRMAAKALPDIHKFDWRNKLPDWQAPESLREQVERWRPIYQKSPESAWIASAEKVEALLLKHLPIVDDNPIGLVHGDYQPGNLLYYEGQVSGVIDWDLSAIGGQLLDIGWLMMMSEGAVWRALGPIPTLDAREIRQIYEFGMGRSYSAIPWFQAYAGFRMGSIACLNVRLHRKGQRHDPVWETAALGVPELFDNARLVLEKGC